MRGRTLAIGLVLAMIVAIVLRSAMLEAEREHYSPNYGSGLKSCGQFLSEITTHVHEISYIAWLEGYITRSKEKDDPRDVLGGVELDGGLSWMQDYCRDHPRDDFRTAANALIHSMSAKRDGRLMSSQPIWVKRTPVPEEKPHAQSERMKGISIQGKAQPE